MKNECAHRRAARWRQSWRLAGCILFFLALGVAAQDDYTIEGVTIDGGGGISSGGRYSVSGSIGQPEAGEEMRSGDYSLTGGLEIVHLLQVPGAPPLRVTVTGPGQVTIFWTPDEEGWVLQVSPDLTAGSWMYCPSGATNPVTVPVDAAQKFYRLARP